MDAMQGFDALHNGFADGIQAAAEVFQRRSQYNALLARYRVVLAERDYNAEIYRDAARRHNELVDENQRLRAMLDLIDD